ncbi:hypothetical protein BH23PLA1_BH23PLA1_13370 [soil metagenome]
MRFQEGPILPPRPNPGPEPWSDSGPISEALFFGLGLALLSALIVLALRGWRRRRSRRRGLGRLASRPDGSALSARDQMIVFSEVVRSTLEDRFGPSWRARTTEEIAGAPELAERLGPERAEQLARFLMEADRAKFAAEAEADHHPEPWADWVNAFLADPDPRQADGASSTITGK